tara:strand:+ start:2025 stop:2969 length:945 start_codon:yes stop_codon:yes gene_type:complete
MRIIILLFFFTISSCSSFKFTQKNKILELKLPFSKFDYPDTEKSLFVIVSAKGDYNLSSLKSALNLNALASISQRVEYLVEGYNKINLKNVNRFSDVLSSSKTIIKSNIFLNKISLVDAKLLKLDDLSYEYWGVYKIDLNDVVTILKSNDPQINLKDDFYKGVIDKEFKLEAKRQKTTKILTENKSPGSLVVNEAKKYIGVPYVWGGDNPSRGFDCSGFVQWVINESINILLPRTSYQQSLFLSKHERLNFDKILPGDILFFNTSGEVISHVGIAIGDHKFIHAPNKKSNIKIDILDGYWKKKLISANYVPNLQ